MGRRSAIAPCHHLDTLPQSIAIPYGGGVDVSAFICCSPRSVPWHRCLKRKLDERDSPARCLSCFANAEGGFARVDIENEAEALSGQNKSVQKLLTELEEERSASSSAATEAMSMILRLQYEKAEAQMEARQFRRLAEEKMAHDQQEIATLEDILFQRDQTVQALTCEVQAYRHRLLSYGIGVDECDAPPWESQTPGTSTSTPTCAAGSQFDAFPCDYPALRCADDSATDRDKYPSDETPRAADSHRDPSRHRNFRLERVRSGSFRSYKDKGFLVRQSPNRMWSDISDKVYTVDAVNGARENFMSTPRELHGNTGIEDEPQEREFKKLYTRLQALEADRELMRKSLISMGTDKAQIALLREIAQQMCKEAATERKVVKRSSSIKKSSSLVSKIKSVVSIASWRKRSSRVKFTFGLSPNNAGLVLLLEKSSSRLKLKRFFSKAQG